MNDIKEITETIRDKLISYYQSKKDLPFEERKIKIPLIVPSYEAEEIIEVLTCLIEEKVTMNEKVFEFERQFSKYVGVNYGTMVNSGSSANLLALDILTNVSLHNKINKGEEVITPAVTWSTTVAPIVMKNLIPVITDVDLDTFNISIEETKKLITKKTKAIMLVHLLGNPANMDELKELAEKHNLYLIEDCCEAHGAMIGNRKVGSFGDLSTFSFFFSHHISTIEGGMILTNNEEFAELSKVLRAHGWIRELKNKQQIANKYKHLDERFLFINLGYNLRPTELQGAMGIVQLKKLEKFIEARRKNADYWISHLEDFSDYLLLHKERPNTRHVWFGFPLILKPSCKFTIKQLSNYLESRGIQTRPIMSGNIVEHPMMNLITYKKGNLKNSDYIMKHGLFIGNHHKIEQKEREYLIEVLEEFFKHYQFSK